MKEIWKDVKGYEGIYRVSNLGKVKSLKRKVNIQSGSQRTVNEKILKNQLYSNGYNFVKLSKDHVSQPYSIHRLVGIAFIPNPQNKPCINHKNGIKTDNRVENLEWVTYSENHKHAFRNGLKKITEKEKRETSKRFRGSNHPSSKLNEKDIPIIRKMYNNGFSQPVIGKKFGVSQGSITRIITGKSWKHV